MAIGDSPDPGYRAYGTIMIDSDDADRDALSTNLSRTPVASFAPFQADLQRMASSEADLAKFLDTLTERFVNMQEGRPSTNSTSAVNEEAMRDSSAVPGGDDRPLTQDNSRDR